MLLRWLRAIFAAALIVSGVLFALAFEARYWRRRDCFNELGRCYDPVSQDVYLEQDWSGAASRRFAAGGNLFGRGAATEARVGQLRAVRRKREKGAVSHA